MFLASVMLTTTWGTNLNGRVILHAMSLLIFGIGVVGEYPMTSTTATEGVHGRSTLSKRQAALREGVLLVALLIFHGGGDPPCGEASAQYTFRVSFGLAAFSSC
ncbi:hypothetical protein BDZ45DRAFT_740560 [Acephala macrosclerotiorum]|nr:hypothetical protein BDZ45DRAFT_740560 [Acephala macrosclerotiorum]